MNTSRRVCYCNCLVGFPVNSCPCMFLSCSTVMKLTQCSLAFLLGDSLEMFAEKELVLCLSPR